MYGVFCLICPESVCSEYPEGSDYALIVCSIWLNMCRVDRPRDCSFPFSINFQLQPHLFFFFSLSLPYFFLSWTNRLNEDLASLFILFIPFYPFSHSFPVSWLLTIGFLSTEECAICAVPSTSLAVCNAQISQLDAGHSCLSSRVFISFFNIC